MSVACVEVAWGAFFQERAEQIKGLTAAEANPPPVAEPEKSKGGVVSKKRVEECTFVVHMTWNVFFSS